METVFNTIIPQLTFYLYGFGLLYAFLFLIGQSRKPAFFETSFKIIPIVGLTYLLSTLVYYGIVFFSAWYSGTSYEQYAFIGPRFMNSLWPTFLLPLLFIFIPTQLFWMDRIRSSKVIIFFLTFFFIVSFERIYIFLSAFHRDYLPGSWTMSTGTIIETMIYSIFLFIVTTFIFHYKNDISKFFKFKQL